MIFRILTIMLALGAIQPLICKIYAQEDNPLPGALKITEEELIKHFRIVSPKEYVMGSMKALRLAQTSSSLSLKVDTSFHCFNYFKEVMDLPKCMGPRIESKADSSFVGYFELQPSPENLGIRPIPGTINDSTRYLNAAKYDLARSLNEDVNCFTNAKILENINFYPKEILKLVSADFGFSYSIKGLEGDDLFRTHKNCDVLVFSHKKNGYFMLYCFFTDEGYRNADYYKSKAIKSFRFSD